MLRAIAGTVMVTVLTAPIFYLLFQVIYVLPREYP